MSQKVEIKNSLISLIENVIQIHGDCCSSVEEFVDFGLRLFFYEKHRINTMNFFLQNHPSLKNKSQTVEVVDEPLH